MDSTHQEAAERLRRGDVAGARAAAQKGLARRPDDPALLQLLGIACCQGRDLAAGAGHLRRALDLEPANRTTRIHLAHALAALGSLSEAEAVCAGADPADAELLRLRAWLLLQLGRPADAAAAYRGLLALEPADFASWTNLGDALLAAGEAAAALDALERARALKQDPLIQLNLARALAACGRFGDAERAYRDGIALAPNWPPLWLGLAALLESANRGGELTTLAGEAAAAGLAAGDAQWLRALGLRREGRFEEALAAARAGGASAGPAERAQLIGELCDRLGDSAGAFAAFAEMNRIAAAAPSNPRAGAAAYRRSLERIAALTTAGWHGGWAPVRVEPDPPAPVFLVGFPRSGTTLLDTVLMGHPALHVLEELPVLQRVNAALGPLERLADLDADEVRALRNLYFAEMEALAPGGAGKLVVDKFPLAIGLVPLIHRIFPDARFIFARRHPCDVVLSCFITDFSLNDAVANFLDLGDAARLYDGMLSYWQQCLRIFPLQVHDFRYEAMVADPEGELRPLVAFLGLDWDDRLLDHRRSAAARGYISSPSYAQVTEKIYSRAAGRWHRYRDQLAPVLPLLAPWAERMGYEL